MTASGPWLVLAAVGLEQRPLRRSARARGRETGDGIRLSAGVLAGQPLLLGVTGEGGHNVSRALRALDQRHPQVPLLFVGVAGALSPDLALGDVITGHRLVNHRGGAAATLALPAAAAGLARPATLLTSDRVVTCRAERSRLHGLAGSGTAAVDMESWYVAESARASGRPLVLVRAISDLAEEDLPPFLAACQRADGSIDRVRVLRCAAAAPGSWRALLRLYRGVRRGARALPGFVRGFIERGGFAAREPVRSAS